MKLRIYAIGKPRLADAARGGDEYTGRLARTGGIGIEFLKPKDETRQLLARSEGSYRIVLDERGRLLTTPELVGRIGELEHRGDVKEVSFLLGGADGHDPAVRDAADFVWALSPLTLQHELALVVLLEQLYRAYAIKRGEPYHR